LNRLNVLVHLRDQGVTAVEGMIAALPPLHKRNVVLVFQSQAGNPEFVSAEFPRVVSYGADSRLVLSWSTNPRDPNYNTVEFLEPAGEKWAAGSIDFRGSVPVIRHPAGCSSCHGNLNKPLWGTSGQYPGTEQDAPSGNGLYSYISAAAYQNVRRAKASSDPRLTPLSIELPTLKTTSRGKEVWSARLQSHAIVDQATDAAMTMQWRHEQVLFHRAVSNGHLRTAQLNRGICPLGDSSAPINIPMAFRDAHLSMRADTGQYLEGVTNPHGTHYCSRVYFCMQPDFHLLVLHDMWQRSRAVRTSLWQNRSWRILKNTHSLLYGTHGKANLDLRKVAGVDASYPDHTDFSAVIDSLNESGVCASLRADGPTALGLAGPPGVGPLEVAGLQLVGSDGRTARLAEGSVLEHQGRERVRFNAQAEVTPLTDVRSMRVSLVRGDLAVRHTFVDNTAPFSLFGSATCGARLPAGDYLVSATPYSQRDGQGRAGPSFTRSFSVRSGVVTARQDRVCSPSQSAETPTVSISGGTGISEGEPANFTITASPAPTEALVVKVEITQRGDFTSVGSRTVTITTSGTARLRLTTANDNIGEPDGAVTATLLAGAGYAVSASHGSATVEVADDDSSATPLRLSINPQQVQEGVGSAQLSVTVELTGTPRISDTDVQVAIVQGGTATEGADYTTLRPVTLRIRAGTRTATGTLTFQPIDDRRVEQDETVLLEASGAGLPAGTATITIVDGNDRLPAITVTSSTPSVSEGAVGRFTLHADEAAALDLGVTVRVSQQGDFMRAGEAGMREVTVRRGQRSVDFVVHTDDDEEDERDGAISVAIVTGAGYRVGVPASVAVAVQDDDAPRVARITAAPARLALDEGGPALSYTVSLSTRPLANVTVTASVADPAVARLSTRGGSLGPSVVLSFTPSNWSRAQTVQVLAQDDSDAVDASTRITHAVQGTGAYAGLTVPPIAVAVTDDDIAREPRFSLARSSVSPVTEGAAARFVLRADQELTENVDVQLHVSQQGNFLRNGESGGRTVTVQRGTNSAEVVVRTDNDSLDEPDGSVSLTILSGRGYQVASNSSASVVVEDDDSPTPARISVAPTSLSLDEGGAPQTYSLSLSMEPAADVTVTASVADPAVARVGARGGSLGRSVVLRFTPNNWSRAQTVQVLAQDDSDAVDASTRIMHAVQGTGAYAGLTVPPVAVAVVDDDETLRVPEVSMTLAERSVTEGADARFTLQVDRVLTEDLVIDYFVDQIGDVLQHLERGHHSVTIRRGERTAEIVVRTDNDRAAESDGIVKVYIKSSSRYAVSSGSSLLSVLVKDDD